MKRVLHYLLAVMLVAGLAALAAGCGGDDDDGGSDKGDDVALTQGRDLTIAVITHGEGDSFWAVAKKARAAGRTWASRASTASRPTTRRSPQPSTPR